MKNLFLVLFGTFIVGMATGAFIYFMSGLREPIIDLPNTQSADGFEITADAYGGCQMAGSCPSYRINEDGAYLYIVLQRGEGGESNRNEGKLSASKLRELEEQIEETPLAEVADSAFSGTCPIAFDGAAYTFTIRVGEAEYRIDTCEQNTEGHELFDSLEEYFSTFSS